MSSPNSNFTFSDPLIERYASPEMLGCFSRERRYQTWRQLWLTLAKNQKQLGLPISDTQLKSIEKALDLSIDFARVEKLEAEFKHDVFAHLHHFAEQCPAAKPILHLGATSAYITDNADLILSRNGLKILLNRLQSLAQSLGNFCKNHKGVRTVGFTHFQVAMPTTVGRRAAYWLQDLLMDGEELIMRVESMRLRGAKGTTGTQASFLKLFDGDENKVRALDQYIAQDLGFKASFVLTAQTYPRKQDTQLMATLVGIAESASKFGNDLRLLQHMHELEEPFSKQQVGSSAMPFKRNPILSERLCSLSRLLMSLYAAAPQTAGSNWLERSLDDSAVRRLMLPQAFLLADALLMIYQKVVDGLQVHPAVIARNLSRELPFLVTEMLMMEGVKSGEDRQELHETIRKHSMATFSAMQNENKENDLLERLAKVPELAPLLKRFKSEKWEERFLVGRAESQVDELLGPPLQQFLNYKS